MTTSKPALLTALLAFVPPVQPVERVVDNARQFMAEIGRATPGSRILLSAGDYPLYRVHTQRGGTRENPIVVGAITPGTARILAQGTEAFSVHHPYWVFEDLVIQGNEHADHAFHITGDTDQVVIRRNTVIDFHAHIKVNGEPNAHFPDRGVIEDNDLLNTSIRHTHLPVTSIDIVGGSGWTVKGNYIADFAKADGDQTSYGLFIKGNSADGRIASNLVVCGSASEGGIRIGISLGGGGTATPYCVNSDCTQEHTGGVIRNNIVLNCSDVGIYLNKAGNTLIDNNTLLMTQGMDIRYPQSSARIRNNILSGAIRERDGGRAEARDNLSFGTTLGMNLPSLARRLKHRVADYDAKFPRWIDHGQVVSWQRAIDRIYAILADSRLGLGLEPTLECFPGLPLGDLTPDPTNCGDLRGGRIAPDNPRDFWDNERSAASSTLGAIDFHVSPCDLALRIRHRPRDRFGACLR